MKVGAFGGLAFGGLAFGGLAFGGLALAALLLLLGRERPGEPARSR